MKKSTFLALCITLITILLTGCNQIASKNFGGTYTIKLKQGQKLETVTWKEGNLWILTRNMRLDEKPETHSFFEDSTFDVMEGTVTIVEIK